MSTTDKVIQSVGHTPDRSQGSGTSDGEHYRLDSGTTPRPPVAHPFNGFPFTIGPPASLGDSAPSNGGAQQLPQQGQPQVQPQTEPSSSTWYPDQGHTEMSATDRMWLGNWIAECNLRSDMPEHARHLDRYGQSRNMLRSEVQKYRDEGMKLMRDFAESSAKQLFEDKDPTVIPYAARMLFQDILKEQQLPPLTQKG